MSPFHGPEVISPFAAAVVCLLTSCCRLFLQFSMLQSEAVHIPFCSYSGWTDGIPAGAPFSTLFKFPCSHLFFRFSVRKGQAFFFLSGSNLVFDPVLVCLPVGNWGASEKLSATRRNRCWVWFHQAVPFFHQLGVKTVLYFSDILFSVRHGESLRFCLSRAPGLYGSAGMAGHSVAF